MEPDQQEALDAQVQEAMQALGETASVETVARKVGRRTETVLQAIRRVTRGTPAVDDETPPENSPAVRQAIAEVRRRRALLARAEELLSHAADTLAQAEAAALTLDELPDLSVPRQELETARHQLDFQQKGVERALEAGAEAYRVAAGQHYTALWAQYQRQVAALLETLQLAFTAKSAVDRAYDALVVAARLAGVETEILPRCRPGLNNVPAFCAQQERDIVRQAAPTTPRHAFPGLVERPDFLQHFRRLLGDDALRTGYRQVRFRDAAELEARGLSARPYGPGEVASFPTLAAQALIASGAAVEA